MHDRKTERRCGQSNPAKGAPQEIALQEGSSGDAATSRIRGLTSWKWRIQGAA